MTNGKFPSVNGILKYVSYTEENDRRRVKVIEFWVVSSYARLGLLWSQQTLISGPSVGWWINRLKDRNVNIRQMNKIPLGMRAVIFFLDSGSGDDSARGMAELGEWINATTKSGLCNSKWDLAAAQLVVDNDRTVGQCILTTPEHQEEVVKAVMSIVNYATEAHQVTGSGWYCPVIIDDSTEEGRNRMKIVIEDQNRMYVARTSIEITGIPPYTDVHSIVPTSTYLEESEGARNLQTIAQIAQTSQLIRVANRCSHQ